MKKRELLILIFIISFTAILTSCELFMSEPEGKIVMISIGLDYKYSTENKTSYGELNGTLNDVRRAGAAMQALSERSGKDFYWIPLFQHENVYSEVEGSSIEDNFASFENFKNVINYLDDNSSDATEPLIITNPIDFSLSEYLSDYEECGTEAHDIELNSNDILIIYYSGHGAVSTGDLYMMSNTSLTATDYSLANFKTAIEKVKSKTLVVLDSCYSGNLIDESNTTIRTRGPDIEITSYSQALDFLFDTTFDDSNNNLFVLASTSKNYESSESSTYNYGYFTKAFLNAVGWTWEVEDTTSLGDLESDIPSLNGGEISLDDIYSYTKDTDHFNKDYFPMISGGRLDLVLFTIN